jgi:hypothetical protein
MLIVAHRNDIHLPIPIHILNGRGDCVLTSRDVVRDGILEGAIAFAQQHGDVRAGGAEPIDDNEVAVAVAVHVRGGQGKGIRKSPQRGELVTGQIGTQAEDVEAIGSNVC